MPTLTGYTRTGSITSADYRAMAGIVRKRRSIHPLIPLYVQAMEKEMRSYVNPVENDLGRTHPTTPLKIEVIIKTHAIPTDMLSLPS